MKKIILIIFILEPLLGLAQQYPLLNLFGCDSSTLGKQYQILRMHPFCVYLLLTKLTITLLIILFFAISTLSFAQQPLRPLKTIMEVEYINSDYGLGTSMLGLGDINSDGKPDIAVSARNIGKTFIYFGGKGVLDRTVDLVIKGGGEMAKGDLNGDGVLDLVVQIWGDSSSSWFNYLAVYLGRENSIIKIDTVPTLMIREEEIASTYGVAFAIGDLNNDGFDELVVGAPGYRHVKGKVYVYCGKTNISSIPDASVEGDKTDSMHSIYGSRIKIADINGDGIKDLAISSDRRRFVDSIWVFDGLLDIFYGRSDWTFSKNGYDQQLDKNNTGLYYIYWPLFNLLDANADGKADISVIYSDSAYFFLGRPDSVSYIPDLILFNPDTSFYRSFSWPSSSIGDINKDGKDDFALHASPGGFSACLIVYLGGSTPQPVAVRCKGFVDTYSFTTIAPLGDVNGDGVNDFGTTAFNALGIPPQDGYFVILSGDSSFVAAVSEESLVPQQMSLSQNYPNPFNLTTIIEYRLERRAHLLLAIYDVLGRRIKTLVDEDQNPGEYRAPWDGTTNKGEPAATGVYYYRILLDGVQQEIKKLLLLR